LYQLEGDALGTLEEPQLSADVVHLVAQHGYAVGHEVRCGRLNVVNAEREVIEAPLPQIRRVRSRIRPRGRVELKQMDIEMRIQSGLSGTVVARVGMQKSQVLNMNPT